MTRVYLGLGCNLGDRLAALERAVRELSALGSVGACSSVYETDPWGVADQPDFLNLCCALETTLSPERLHAETKAIEARLGRIPGRRWGPRAIDVDLLAYGDLRIETPRLSIPHPRIAGRAFVLVPLAEIAPDATIPGLPGTVAALARALPDADTAVRRCAPPIEVPALPALEPLIDGASGEAVPLPAELERLYGQLRLPSFDERPYVFANFVTSLDGVVSMGRPGQAGAEISGASVVDRAVMGLLRAVADLVVVGADTFRAVPRHRWTPAATYRPLGDAYRRVREAMGKPVAPTLVVVSARGRIPPDLPVLRSGRVPVVLVTTAAGGERLAGQAMGPHVRVVAAGTSERISGSAVLVAAGAGPGSRVLVEGGPHLLGTFLRERLLDELFLTLAPQVAGRAAGSNRLSLLEGELFGPPDPCWATLLSAKRSASLLFLRYAFP